MSQHSRQDNSSNVDTKLVRCLRLLETMHEHGEISTKELLALLGTERKNLMRDLRTLRSIGVPIHWVGNGRSRRHRLSPHYRRSPESGEERLAQAIGRGVLARGHLSWDEAELASPVPPLLVLGPESAGPDAAQATLDGLLGALAFHRNVEVQLAGHDPFHASPLGLVSIAGTLLLVADCAGTPTVIRTDRIHDVSLLDDRSSVEPVQSLEQRLGEALGLHDSPRTVVPVEIRFEPTVVGVATALVWPVHSKWTVHDDKSASIRTVMAATDALDRVLRVGVGVRAITPAAFQAFVDLADSGIASRPVE